MATVPKDLEQDSYVAVLMDSVASKWHIEFRRFIETGEAQEAFLDYLNQDAAAQDAVEKAFNHQATQFERLATELKKRNESKGAELSASVARSSTSSKLAAVVEAAIHTPKDQREEVVQTSTAELAASMPVEERKVLKEIVTSLESNLSKLVDATHSP